MVGVDDLVELFIGGVDSTGYAQAELIIELCSRTGKDVTPTVDWVYNLIYPGQIKDTIPVDIQSIVVEGVKLWYRRGSPRHKKTP